MIASSFTWKVSSRWIEEIKSLFLSCRDSVNQAYSNAFSETVTMPYYARSFRLSFEKKTLCNSFSPWCIILNQLSMVSTAKILLIHGSLSYFHFGNQFVRQNSQKMYYESFLQGWLHIQIDNFVERSCELFRLDFVVSYSHTWKELRLVLKVMKNLCQCFPGNCIFTQKLNDTRM